MGARNVFVKLPGDVADTLIRLAVRNGLHPKDEAARLIREGLERVGALPGQQTERSVLTETIAESATPA